MIARIPFNQTVYYSAVILPYLAVAIGLYMLQSAWAAIGGYHLGMLLLLMIVACPPVPVKSKWPMHLRYLVGFNMGGSLLAGVFVYFLWPWLAMLSTEELVPFLSGWSLGPANWPVFVVYFCLINPWLEELYWRHWLSQAGHPTLETSIWFAGYHGLVLLPLLHGWAIILALIILIIVGWWWTKIIQLGGSLLGPTACHIAADVSIILAVNQLYNMI